MPHNGATVEQNSPQSQAPVSAEPGAMAESVLQIVDQKPTELGAPEMCEEEVQKLVLAAATEWYMARNEEHPLSYCKLAEKH